MPVVSWTVIIDIIKQFNSKCLVYVDSMDNLVIICVNMFHSLFFSVFELSMTYFDMVTRMITQPSGHAAC